MLATFAIKPPPIPPAGAAIVGATAAAGCGATALGGGGGGAALDLVGDGDLPRPNADDPLDGDDLRAILNNYSCLIQIN